MSSEIKLRRVEATDERQYMIHEGYEVYEKYGQPIGTATMHYHNFYEIVYVLEGEYSSLLRNRTYNMKKGDFLLVDRNEMHMYHYEEKKHDNSRRIILWITDEMLQKLSEGNMDLAACFRKHNSYAYHFPIYYEEMLRGYLLKLAMSDSGNASMPGAKEVMDRGYLSLLFAHLNLLCEKKEYLLSEKELIQHPLVEQVSDYIEAHIGETIHVDELAEQVHMSKYYFLRKFKNLTGVTVHTYLTNKRMIYACGLLKQDVGVTEVARLCGFADYTVFLRNFKAMYGVAPGKYKDFY